MLVNDPSGKYLQLKQQIRSVIDNMQKADEKAIANSSKSGAGKAHQEAAAADKQKRCIVTRNSKRK